jgi:hypothetical protein
MTPAPRSTPPVSRAPRALAPLLAAVVGVAAAFVAAPPARAQEWAAGYTLGVTNSEFNDALGDTIPQSMVGFGFGVFFAYPLNTVIRLQPEMLISVKGGSFKEPVFGFYYDQDSVLQEVKIGDVKRVMDLTYIEVPLIVSASVLGGPSSSFRPHLQAGIAPAFRILGRYRNGSYTGDQPVDPDKANRFDVAWVAGLGADMRTRRALLRFDLRYTAGMMDVYNEAHGPPGRNQVWSLIFSVTP